MIAAFINSVRQVQEESKQVYPLFLQGLRVEASVQAAGCNPSDILFAELGDTASEIPAEKITLTVKTAEGEIRSVPFSFPPEEDEDELSGQATLERLAYCFNYFVVTAINYDPVEQRSFYPVLRTIALNPAHFDVRDAHPESPWGAFTNLSCKAELGEALSIVGSAEEVSECIHLSLHEPYVIMK